MSLPTPNYVITEDFSWGSGTDAKILPARSFVRPIDDRWVPQHVFDNWRTRCGVGEIYCSTKYGIIPVKKSIIRQV